MGFNAIAVLVLLHGRTGRVVEIEEKRELYVRDGEVEERSHDVVRICGLVWTVSDCAFGRVSFTVKCFCPLYVLHR